MVSSLEMEAAKMPESYFWCCSYPLGVGSVVFPGNWGRILKLYTPQSGHNAWLLVQELVFEEIRFREFSSKPSRFETVFLCRTTEDILQFREASNRIKDLVYEVELVEPARPSHVGDMALACCQASDNFESFASRARCYWSGEGSDQPETITTSAIRIMKRIDATKPGDEANS